ncbi:hypothetical protein DFH09DRAFT_1075826 [Mycena vulgaris]|nr:hypothetical protein DFH09DRAFT_1075826 [Mycena vulgaris]
MQSFGGHDYPSSTDGSGNGLNYAFEMERVVSVIPYGVHLNMSQPACGRLPSRAESHTAGMPVFEALVEECMEEASPPEPLVCARTPEKLDNKIIPPAKSRCTWCKW